ncbi:hypothetical protein MY4824_004558 [Beauveria thailandica]
MQTRLCQEIRETPSAITDDRNITSTEIDRLPYPRRRVQRRAAHILPRTADGPGDDKESLGIPKRWLVQTPSTALASRAQGRAKLRQGHARRGQLNI